jgi:hypothetical protein
MRTGRTHARAATVTGLAALVAGCGTTAASLTTVSAHQAGPLSLATTSTTTAATWGVVLVGGKAADHNNFWQLLVRRGSSPTWQLVTPPGVASNGGLVIAPLAGQSLVAGFLPSQALIFTPLASTGDSGRSWSSGAISAGLAKVPGALAGDPATGKLLALTTGGSVERGDASGRWTVIARKNGVSAGADCGRPAVAGVALSGSGTPLAAVDCSRPGVAGIFAYAAGSWRISAPAVPRAFARDAISVLALGTVGGRTFALLQAGTGTGASVLAAELNNQGWAVSGPASLRGAEVASLAANATGEIGLVLTGGKGLLLASQGSPWRALPRLPVRTQVLALGPGTDVQALAPGRVNVAIYDYQQAQRTWTMSQNLKVPVQFGSSG